MWHDRATLNPAKPGLVAREEFLTVTYIQNSHSPPEHSGSGSSHLFFAGPEPAAWVLAIQLLLPCSQARAPHGA